jgi:hypothetical protein
MKRRGGEGGGGVEVVSSFTCVALIGFIRIL